MNTSENEFIVGKLLGKLDSPVETNFRIQHYRNQIPDEEVKDLLENLFNRPL